jgi:amino-acid N-acetyltransferase
VTPEATPRALAALQATEPPGTQPFSEKGFYLDEFRGRTLAIAASAPALEPIESVRSVLAQLAENHTRAVLLSNDPSVLESLCGTPALGADADRLETAVWRGFARAARVGLHVTSGPHFESSCHAIALRLGLSKLVWIDPDAGLRRPDGRRDSFIDLEALRGLLRDEPCDEPGLRLALLREIERALAAGLPAVNLCSAAGLGDELFTYAGSGTLFTRERYIRVRRLTLDDFDAANDLVARGVSEGYLAHRAPEEIERVLASGFGAFVEGRHLAGIGALLGHDSAGAGEIASLYTLTRFLGEGVGGHLVSFGVESARKAGCGYVFACTTSPRVAEFFEREGFRRVAANEIPPEKWQGYDPERRSRVVCLRQDLGDVG